jgi:hypothetical protein
VLVVEVDVVHAQALERRVACLAHVLGVATDAQALAVLVAHVAELGGDHNLVAPVGDSASDELLVCERAVHVRCVKEVDPELERALDRADRLALVGVAVELRHPHAAEPFGRHLQALASELLRIHPIIASAISS